MDNYEINSSTLAIMPIDDETSKVYEEEEIYIVNKSSNSIIKENCEFYGSTYQGRCIGTKTLTGIKGKFPIIIEESRNIIFFPTASIRNSQSSWFALNKIKTLQKINNNSKVFFNNNTSLLVNASIYSLENQILRANLLNSKLYSRKQEFECKKD